MIETFIKLSILFDEGPKKNRVHRREIMDKKNNLIKIHEEEKIENKEK